MSIEDLAQRMDALPSILRQKRQLLVYSAALRSYFWARQHLGGTMTVVRDAEPGDKYSDKLGKILPAELTATYFLLRSFAGDSPALTQYLLLMALILCVAFYFVSPKLISMATQKNRMLYAITFLFWVAAIDPSRIATDFVRAPSDQIAVYVFMMSGLAAIWSFFVPFVMDERS
jgi:hypothetical protein